MAWPNNKMEKVKCHIQRYIITHSCVMSNHSKYNFMMMLREALIGDGRTWGYVDHRRNFTTSLPEMLGQEVGGSINYAGGKLQCHWDVQWTLFKVLKASAQIHCQSASMQPVSAQKQGQIQDEQMEQTQHIQGLFNPDVHQPETLWCPLVPVGKAFSYLEVANTHPITKAVLSLLCCPSKAGF